MQGCTYQHDVGGDGAAAQTKHEHAPVAARAAAECIRGERRHHAGVVGCAAARHVPLRLVERYVCRMRLHFLCT